MRASLLFFAVVLTACPPAGKKQEAVPATCATFGQTCEFSPGKLGSCVIKDGCTDAPPACLVCQSQH